MGETEIDRSESGERLFQCAQMDEPVLGASAIPLEILWNHIEQYCFGERNIRMLQQYEDFPGLQFQSHSLYYVHQFAVRELGIEILISSLEREFNCPPATVKKTLRNALKPPKPRGRHNAVPDNSEANILAWIQHQAENSQPATRTDIRHYSTGKLGKPITRA
jgi:hypothetical protein